MRMDNLRKILIIQLKRAGDVILTTPCAALLKRRFPQARIDFLVEKAFAPLLEHNPEIDAVQLYDKNHVWNTLRRIRSERYNCIFDFQTSPRSTVVVLASGAAHTAGYQVPFWGHAYRQTVRRPGERLTVVEGKVSLLEAIVGPLGDIPQPQMTLTEKDQRWAESAMEKGNKRGPVGLVPTHRRESRRWHAESFATLAQQLCAPGVDGWPFWGPGEQPYIKPLLVRLPHAPLH